MRRGRLGFIGAILLTGLLLGACESSDVDGTTSTTGGTNGEGGGSTTTAGSPDTTADTPDDVTLTMLVAEFGNERFDPANVTGQGGYGQLIHATLIDAGNNGELVPGIAESWDVSDDGLTWTFIIRDDVVFHNGETLTADDVAFSLSDTFGPETIESSTVGANASIAAITQSIEVTAPNTVAVQHTEPVPFFAFMMSSQDSNHAGAIFPQAYFEEVGRDGYNQAPVGAGPFRVVSFQSGQEIQMERFDDYYDPSRISDFRFLNYQLVPELATRVQALASGDADLIQADLTVANQVTEAGNSLTFAPEAAYIWFMMPGCWNVDLPCNDLRVRQALDLALDKDLIMSQLYGDAWQNAGWQFVTPSVMGYSEDFVPYPYNPDEARRLLAEAGYPNGEGFPTLVINTSGAQAVPLLPEFALVVAQQLQQELGILTEVRVGDANSLRTQWQGRELDGQIFIRDNNARWDGAGFARAVYGDLARDIRLNEDPEIISLIDTATAAVTPDERDAAYNEAYRAIRAANYEIATGTLSLVWGVSPRVAGWEPWPLNSRPTALWTISVEE